MHEGKQESRLLRFFTSNHFKYINIAACQAFGQRSSVCAIVQLYVKLCRIARKRLEEKNGLVFIL